MEKKGREDTSYQSVVSVLNSDRIGKDRRRGRFPDVRLGSPPALPAGSGYRGLFIAVVQWNSWFDTFLFTSSKQNLSTLQYELMKLLSSSMNSNSNPAVANGADLSAIRNMVTLMSIRASITIASVPILVVYPFLQKYFVHGLQLGSVKE
ncbi:ABC-type glycerol-3-phosphate transport system permease component [Paenibacillus sp. V4I3]|nr:ABC-type glycerol-3-phosphate transport system permease component [Paenibacillus sp. V4I3]